MQTDLAPAVRTALTGTLFVAGLWAVLVVLRPATTFHLAPLLLAMTYPYLRWRDTPARPTTARVFVDAVGAGVATVVLLLIFNGLDRLQGPVLFGGNPVGEGLILTAAGIAGSLAIGLSRSRRHGDGQGARR